ncbi:MAG TPA: copper chaperone PCu(A)C [Acidimicrobiales bacterium]|nr:copper chaperone PCu(A)C [Acidimicrobiales bacterium]
MSLERLRRHKGWAALGALPAVLIAAVILEWTWPAGHPAGAASPTGAALSVAARVGDIEVIDPFVPAPASPAVAAFYATFRNLGSAPDALVGAATAAAGSASLHTEMESGNGGMMMPLARLVIPAHGTAALRPAHDHVMLEGLRSTLVSGQTIVLQLHFQRAGTLDVPVPVVPQSALVGDTP